MRASYSSKLSVASPETQIDRATVLKVFAALVVITFLLRIFYSGQLYEDDGLWFTAAEEILRGKALYREIYFDKPPAIALAYAGLFKLFGAHILTIRLFTIICSIVISIVLYLFGKQLYDKRTGLIAAAMFTVFSTTYQEGHFQGLNTDFLMALPYTAGAYLLIRSRADLFSLARTQSAWLAFCGGMLTGIASQINPKAHSILSSLRCFYSSRASGGQAARRPGDVSLFAFAHCGTGNRSAAFFDLHCGNKIVFLLLALRVGLGSAICALLSGVENRCVGFDSEL